MQRVRGENGFTVVEVVLTIVILGLIAVPLSMALMQAIRQVPEAGARTSNASDRFFLTNTFARDTANAATVNYPPSNTTVDHWCLPFGAQAPQPIYEATWHDGAAVAVAYDAIYTAVPGTTVITIAVRRTVNGTSSIVATGVCEMVAYWKTPWTSPVRITNSLPDDGSQLHRRIEMELRLMSGARSEIDVATFEGALGRTR